MRPSRRGPRYHPGARAFEHLGSNRIASLLWQIFLDARRFFSSAVDRQGHLPQSHLRHILNEVRLGTVSVGWNVPTTLLAGGGDSSRELYLAAAAADDARGGRGAGTQ